MEQIQVCKVATYAPIHKLKFHPKNSELREITRERTDDLKNSIKKKGFYEPLLVWKKGGVVLAGEHRIKAALELIEEGFEFVTTTGKKNCLPVVVEDCDEDTAYEILHESNNHYATYIDIKLAAALKEAEQAGKDLGQMGFSNTELDELMKSALEDANEVLDQEPESEEYASHGVNKLVDEYESLTLPKDVYNQLMGILSEVAKAIEPDWKKGDSVVNAMQALCQLIKESGALNQISK